MNTHDINREYISLLKINPQAAAGESAAIVEKLTKDAAQFGGTPVEFLEVPKFYTKQIDSDFKRIAETMHRILVKVMNEYRDNPRYRQLFGYDELAEGLILSNAGYPAELPIIRIDLFYNEETGDFRFCEFNTDGSSGMGEETDLVRELSSTQTFRRFSSNYDISSHDLFEGLIDAFLDVYDTFPGKSGSPLFCIGDFMESGVTSEFSEFSQRFEKRGFRTIIADVRELEFDGQTLSWKGQTIDAVYRRAVTGEMLRKRESIPDFIAAILSGNCCIIGHPRTQIPHTKIVFEVLRNEETLEILTKEESEFILKSIPFTTELKGSRYSYNSVLLNKDRWVVKPSDMYASSGVTVGRDSTPECWREALEAGVRENYLLQEYVEPYKSRNAVFKHGELVEDDFGNIIGLYVYNGKYGGMFTRMGKRGIISSQTEGFSAGSMVVSPKK